MANLDAKRLETIADLRLPDAAGISVRLGDAWNNGPAILVWLRHYG